MKLRGTRLYSSMTFVVLSIIVLFMTIILICKKGTKQRLTAGENSSLGIGPPPAIYANPSPELLDTGRRVYTQNCSSCHGDSGKGDGSTGKFLNPHPRNFRSEPLKFGSHPENIFHTITVGISGSMMASFEFLVERDRWAVVHYIRSFMPN